MAGSGTPMLGKTRKLQSPSMCVVFDRDKRDSEHDLSFYMPTVIVPNLG